MEECGNELNVQFLSNSPVAYHSYTCGKLNGSQLTGAKVRKIGDLITCLPDCLNAQAFI